MISISKNRCVGCGICINSCPQGALLIDDCISVVNQDKCTACGICVKVCPQNAIMDIRETLVFAIGTDDGRHIKSDDHVGVAKYYMIWKYADGQMSFVEKRRNVKYDEDETRIHGDPGKAKSVISILQGVDVIVGRIFGPNIVRTSTKFVSAVVREPVIENAIVIIKENINEIIEEKNKKERRGLVLA